MSTRHHDIPSSTGSVRPEDLDLYALDALDENEADSVETALISASPDEKASMLAHIASTREVVAGIVASADLDTAPPPQLRGRVMEIAATTTPRVPARPADTVNADRDEARGGADVVDLSRERERRRPGPLSFLAVAAAAVVLVAGGVVVGRVTDRAGSESSLPVAAPSMPGKVTSLLAAEDLSVVRGQVGGTGTATVLASKTADMAVISMTGLPEPAEGRAYQLWLMGAHEPISAGTMEAGEVGTSPSAQIDGIRDSEQIGITEEPAGGSPAPTGQVLLALDID
ncbi:anti-sigma factor [Dietzia sp. ANT_WB102]|uniref:anti-sigma factor n=1 Tax=Dietzia sp. ANT_WB102 TaxID=2597345 RepID=UPI0011ED88AA|nr:anti-sigma factor [Dietzia sp. ANT_WB102]KAA0918571.1 anti-sigma factor [Dietzia sp. ANT_WB102]